MSSADKSLSEVQLPASKRYPSFKIGVVVSRWNDTITNALLEGALLLLEEYQVPKTNIETVYVPGTYELAYGAKLLAQKKGYDAIICLGCVIQGETRHFDFICDATAHGIMQVGLEQDLPVIFGVLTTDNHAQAEDRAGGKHGNKGVEAAATALEMALLKLSV